MWTRPSFPLAMKCLRLATDSSEPNPWKKRSGNLKNDVSASKVSGLDGSNSGSTNRSPSRWRTNHLRSGHKMYRISFTHSLQFTSRVFASLEIQKPKSTCLRQVWSIGEVLSTFLDNSTKQFLQWGSETKVVIHFTVAVIRQNKRSANDVPIKSTL